ncbi:DUF4179 domain-containing protein [Bacillus sp. Marseille-Q3570]|uniref:DUF4179 domain-containing protein n=1 Tax=Bacillus sp. Marseille-Q3570 TaxID=2963522 RepID=UPI0021B79CD1|nr:DUF4179 domain-containing protein [Bacillus sp. Marseille-Q3570]
MSNLEKKLKEDGENIHSMKAPDGLEDRLRNRLDMEPPKMPKRWKRPSLIAASLIFILLFTYQFDTMAYYGKKILGFDHVLTDSLSDLNEQGKGQVIDKSTELPNGIQVTVDGLMLDKNRLIVMYTVFDPRKNIEHKFSDFNIKMESFFGQIIDTSGFGTVNDDNTKMSFVQSFEPPNPFVKNIDFHIRMDQDPSQAATISFELDRSKALMTKYDLRMKETLKTDTATYEFEKLTATPTQTVIKGKINVKNQKVWNEMGMGHLAFQYILKADNEMIRPQGSGMTSSIGGYTFDLEFDPLPEDVENVTLILERDLKIHESDEKINPGEDSIQLAGENLTIGEINVKEGKTEMILNTPEHFSVLEARLEGEGGTASLDTSYDKSFDKTEDGLEKQHVLVFDGEITKVEMLTITKYVTAEPSDKAIQITGR